MKPDEELFVNILLTVLSSRERLSPSSTSLLSVCSRSQRVDSGRSASGCSRASFISSSAANKETAAMSWPHCQYMKTEFVLEPAVCLTAGLKSLKITSGLFQNCEELSRFKHTLTFFYFFHSWIAYVITKEPIWKQISKWLSPETLKVFTLTKLNHRQTHILQ